MLTTSDGRNRLALLLVVMTRRMMNVRIDECVNKENILDIDSHRYSVIVILRRGMGKREKERRLIEEEETISCGIFASRLGRNSWAGHDLDHRSDGVLEGQEMPSRSSH
jgi:hypothetical protein